LEALNTFQFAAPLYTEKTNNLVNNSCGSLPYSDGYPFGNSDVAGNEIYLGQPVLHTLQPPEQIPNVSAFPATTTPHTAVPSLNIVSNGNAEFSLFCRSYAVKCIGLVSGLVDTSSAQWPGELS